MPCTFLCPSWCLVHDGLFINIDDGLEPCISHALNGQFPHREKHNTTLSLVAIEPKQCNGHTGVTNMSD